MSLVFLGRLDIKTSTRWDGVRESPKGHGNPTSGLSGCTERFEEYRPGTDGEGRVREKRVGSWKGRERLRDEREGRYGVRRTR